MIDDGGRRMVDGFVEGDTTWILPLTTHPPTPNHQVCVGKSWLGIRTQSSCFFSNLMSFLVYIYFIINVYFFNKIHWIKLQKFHNLHPPKQYNFTKLYQTFRSNFNFFLSKLNFYTSPKILTFCFPSVIPATLSNLSM